MIVHGQTPFRPQIPTALLIGNFDGVHRGHRYLIQHALTAAEEFQGEALALTFDPHPTRIIAPERASPSLLSLDRRVELLLAAGLQHVAVQPFNKAFAEKNARTFVQDVLLPLSPRQLIVGSDFRFGKKREGTVEMLTELGQEFGYGVQAISHLPFEGSPISSSRIRQALAQGNLALANVLLGRPFDFDGVVVRGEGRGRTLGIPTANIQTQAEALPSRGVYAVQIRILNDAETTLHLGVMNIGTRPTFHPEGAAQPSTEVHLLDFNRNLYGRALRVFCIKRLRKEQTFDGIEALKTQIKKDIEQARELFKKEPTAFSNTVT